MKDLIVGKLDYKKFFNNEVSGYIVQPEAGFGKPTNFEIRINDVKRRFGVVI